MNTYRTLVHVLTINISQFIVVFALLFATYGDHIHVIVFGDDVGMYEKAVQQHKK